MSDVGCIKAIETEYNGYRFRSRLEARWAVFFDALDVRYEYEPEGFELPDGRYLPDFYLPEFRTYIEIKPFDHSVVSYVGDGNRWEKTCAAFRDETERAIMICYGAPADDSFNYLFAWDATYSGGGIYENEAAFVCCGGSVYIACLDYRDDRDIYVTAGYDSSDRVTTVWRMFNRDKRRVHMAIGRAANDYVLGNIRFDCEQDDPLNTAKKEARQARFEYGETPQPTLNQKPSTNPKESR